MKKQINPTIKAHLIRSAFYLLLLFALCAIPLALAQRDTSEQHVADLASSPNKVAKISAVAPSAGAVHSQIAGPAPDQSPTDRIERTTLASSRVRPAFSPRPIAVR